MLKSFITAGFSVLSFCFMMQSNAQIKTLSGRTLETKSIDSFIRYQMDSLKIPALSIAIIQKGKVIYYKATGVRNEKHEAIDTATLFEAASMTKPVFAYAVHKLIQQGKLSLDTPLYRYYPYNDISYDDRYKLITARMVLDHTTGFPNWRDGRELTIGSDPGTNYGYSGEGYVYLGFVVSHLIHKPIEDITNQEVFRPLGIRNSYLIENKYVLDHLADGKKDNKEWGRNGPWQGPNVASSLRTEAKEYAKFVIELMRENRSSGTVFQQMSAPQMKIDSNKWVCLGIFMEQTPYGIAYSHGGNNNNRYNSNFKFYKDHDLGYVFFMNCHQEQTLTKRLDKFLKTAK